MLVFKDFYIKKPFLDLKWNRKPKSDSAYLKVKINLWLCRCKTFSSNWI